jgi:DNA-binding helix-hairpin-helix protein with protein kinase domain
MKFKKGDKIELESGESAIIKTELGDGAQGVVYLVSINGNDFALKWYKEPQDKNFVANLRNNINKGSPSKDFLWPLKLTKEIDNCIGYVMDLRPKNYKDLVEYLAGRVKFSSLTTTLNWCISMADSFKILHTKGLWYQDINEGSFFADFNTGEVLICDNDNVGSTNNGIIGKMRFMAPEIVTRSKMPDRYTDYFSLAVLLFFILVMGHPYEGEKLKTLGEFGLSSKNKIELYGSNPVYVYHEKDASNRPIPTYHFNTVKKFKVLPHYLQEAFHKVFVEGVVDRENNRLSEMEWIKLLSRYRDDLFLCEKCKNEFIGINEKGGPIRACPYCKHNNVGTMLLQINETGSKVIISAGKQLYKTHIEKYSAAYNEVIGEIVANPKNKLILGIKNLSTKDWSIKSADELKELQPNKVGLLKQGLLIEFGNGSNGNIK